MALHKLTVNLNIYYSMGMIPKWACAEVLVPYGCYIDNDDDDDDDDDDEDDDDDDEDDDDDDDEEHQRLPGNHLKKRMRP